MRTLIPLLTSIVTIIGIWLAGSHRWEGWAVGLGNQLLWLVFIVMFKAWGLLLLTAALSFVYTRNLLRWKRLI